MRNFQLIGNGIETQPLLHAVTRQKHLWNQNTLRTQYENGPHSQADDIWLRFNDLSTDKIRSDIMSNCEIINYSAWDFLPQSHEIIFNLMRYIKGVRLGRVMITRLAPGKRIDLHEDGGNYAEYYDRYHVILQNNPGSIFRAGNEEVCMNSGEVWWFDNQEKHEVINNSREDRITMIVDIKIV